MGREYGFKGVHFPKGNKFNGIAVGETGVICKTSNGGTNWDTSTVGTKNLNSVFLTDTSNAIVVGDTGTILRTTNGGTTWTTANKRNNKKFG